IPCEECVTLYPERYQDNPQGCPVCYGQKERFQPARMMDGELVNAEARELELKIEDFLLKVVLNARERPVSVETLTEIRDLYREKLIFYLVYDEFELEPIKAHLLELDGLIGRF
ncbi:MAG: hypothetical protein J3T61_07535, partial [Candidatus Brocadiales bacterium]|nr:hypothetical protein [Candidatus Bathyanammoxibius sp.]